MRVHNSKPPPIPTLPKPLLNSIVFWAGSFTIQKCNGQPTNQPTNRKTNKSQQKYNQHFTNSALPVKFTPARWYDELMTWPNKLPDDGIKLITPAGRPASRNILNTRYEDKTAEWLGFHSTTLPYKHHQYYQHSPLTLMLYRHLLTEAFSYSHLLRQWWCKSKSKK